MTSSAVNMSKTRQRWTKEKVLEAIRNRQVNNLPLNSQAVVDTELSLWAAARRLFGNWRAALDEAGVDSSSVHSRGERHARGYWTRERIVDQIYEYARIGCRMNARNMQKLDNQLIAAATYHFGSWRAALEAASVDSEVVRANIQRTPSQIKEEIRSASSQGADLSDKTVRYWARGLYGAAQTHFGSWPEAVKASGVDYEGIRRHRVWNRSQIQATVDEFLNLGLPIKAAIRHHSYLYEAIKREWGSLQAFYDDMGLTEAENIGQPDELARKFRSAREDAGLSQEAVGDMIGVSRRAVHAYETGQVAIPLSVALRMAKALKMSVEDLFGAQELTTTP